MKVSAQTDNSPLASAEPLSRQRLRRRLGIQHRPRSARTDLSGGNAKAIFNSGRKLFALPDATNIWIGHDYPPEDQDKPVPFMTVKHLRDGTAKVDFIEMRRRRDDTRASPRLIHASLQTNIRGGRLPRPTASDERMPQIPVKVEVTW